MFFSLVRRGVKASLVRRGEVLPTGAAPTGVSVMEAVASGGRGWGKEMREAGLWAP